MKLGPYVKAHPVLVAVGLGALGLLLYYGITQPTQHSLTVRTGQGGSGWGPSSSLGS